MGTSRSEAKAIPARVILEVSMATAWQCDSSKLFASFTVESARWIRQDRKGNGGKFLDYRLQWAVVEWYGSFMTDETLDQEPVDAATGGVVSYTKTRRPFAKLRRELSDDELTSPAVQRLLLDEIERLDREVSELEKYRTEFHEVDKRCAVVEQRVKKSLGSEIIFGVCLCVGAAALGYAPSVWSHQPSGYLAVAFGSILIVCGVASKLVQR